MLEQAKEMKARWIIALLGIAAAWPSAALGASFENYGILDNPAPISAETVENYGVINIATSGQYSLPFSTQNTKVFINHGSGTIEDFNRPFDFSFRGTGFLFDYFDSSTGLRGMADVFNNTGQIFSPGRIEISAKDILVNSQGLISADRRGAVELNGENINLFNGRIRASDGADRVNFSEGTITYNALTYENPLNVREDAWGVTASNPDDRMSIASLAFSPGFSPFHTVTNAPGSPNFTTLSGRNVAAFSPNFYMDSDFNQISVANGTNFVLRSTVNMVFVETNVANMADLQVGFLSATNSNNFDVHTSVIEFSVTDRDVITGAPFTRTLSLFDESSEVAQPNVGLSPHFMQQNQDRNGRFRPRAHFLTRNDGSTLGFFGQAAPQDYDSDMVFTFTGNSSGRYSTNIVAHESSSSDFTVGPFDFANGALGGEFSPNPADFLSLQDITNAAGRVRIKANQLDLELASIRAENLLSISASNITSSAGMRLDAPFIDLELLSTDNVVISNFFPARVSRMNGQISVWSGVWQVQQGLLNEAPATYDPFRNGFRSWFGTNSIDYTYQMTVVDHNISSNMPVTVPRLTLLSDQVTLVDPISVSHSFFLAGESFTFAPVVSSNSLTFTGNLTTINASNAPALNNLTNNGVITSSLQANFGFDRVAPYSNIVNNGVIQSGSALFRANYFENTNTLSAVEGSLFITAKTNRLNGGSLFGSISVRLEGDDLAATNTTLVTDNLVLNIKDRLSDEDTTNSWTVNSGVNMVSSPVKGDLLATTLSSIAGTNRNNVHIWNSEDRGDHPAGFANNAALGRLVLDGSENSRFFFNGSGAGSALYVDTIQLNNNATNFESAISVSSNLKIYFANLVDTNNLPLPADKFTNAHSGQICWVSESTRSGPIVTIALGIGQSTNMTTQAMRALLPASGDYDGDGIRNSDDTTPLSGFTLNSVSTVGIADPPGSEPTPHAKIVWQGIPNTTYIVEYRNSIGDGSWIPLTVLISTSSGEMTAYDPLPADGRRFYRVRYSR